jgi:hypothetical protein
MAVRRPVTTSKQYSSFRSQCNWTWGFTRFCQPNPRPHTQFPLRSILKLIFHPYSRAIAQAIYRQPLTAEARIRPQASPRGTWRWTKWHWNRFLSEYVSWSIPATFHSPSLMCHWYYTMQPSVNKTIHTHTHTHTHTHRLVTLFPNHSLISGFPKKFIRIFHHSYACYMPQQFIHITTAESPQNRYFQTSAGIPDFK